jgi:serine protease AprX
VRRPALLIVAAALSLNAAASPAAPDAKIAPWLLARLSSAHDSFLVLFDDPRGQDASLAMARGASARGRAVYDRLRFRAGRRQEAVRVALEAAKVPYRTLYVVDGLAVRGDLALARRLAGFPNVVRLVGDPLVRGIESDLLAAVTPAAPASAPEWGILDINADDVWSVDGARGEGIVVASADTGVEWTHPALQAKYRGWDGTAAHHDDNWFDAIDETADPLDDNNHGTHTTGTMVGDDGFGNQIGVAPGARWIACRNMDHGNGRPSTYLACMQFFLAPFPHGGDPETDGDPSLAPDIVNNSWTCPPSEGCDPETLEAGFAALRAAGILAVAAAGNGGPSCSSVTDPPAIYGDALVAGAVDDTNALASFSSKGPVLADGSNRLRPDVAAPGVSVRSSIRGGAYASLSGTSRASPHTAGAAALLWSAKPQVRGLIGITRCLLERSAASGVHQSFLQSCGGTDPSDRPNDLWGYGLVDAYGALHALPDGDGDGIANDCDCAPADAGAYDVPPEVGGVVFAADKSTLNWTALARTAGAGTVYDALRGDLDTLRDSGTESGSCLGEATTAASLSDSTAPAPQAGFFYLVAARNGCGGGDWGTASDGTPRSHASCP